MYVIISRLRWISFVLKFIIYIAIMNLIWVFVAPYRKSISPKDARKQPTIHKLYVSFFSQDRKIRLISSSWLKPGNKSESNDVITSTHCAKSKINPRIYFRIKQDTFKIKPLKNRVCTKLDVSPSNVWGRSTG